MLWQQVGGKGGKERERQNKARDGSGQGCGSIGKSSPGPRQQAGWLQCSTRGSHRPSLSAGSSSCQEALQQDGGQQRRFYVGWIRVEAAGLQIVTVPTE